MNQLTGRVLLTGGSGFIARAIYRRAGRESWPVHFTCLSRGEHAQDVVKQQFPDVECVIGDVRDPYRLTEAFQGVNTVIHAGAIKRVPEAELMALETVKTNIVGSMNVIEVAKATGVQQVIGIGTDKCCRPINHYGLTKGVMERLFAESSTPSTRFTSVRYGNVVGSTGSVIPLFQRQLQESGMVSVTDPKMTRFWMSYDEAIDCILFALGEDRVPGGVVVPRPRAMSLGALAACIAGDRVRVIGSRPGEKVDEELIHYQESIRVIHHLGNSGHPPFYELTPVGYGNGGRMAVEPFTLASHSAKQIEPDEMLAMIHQAECI